MNGSIYTINGEMKLIDLGDLPSFIERERVNSGHVSYAAAKPATPNHWGGIQDDIISGSGSAITRHDVALDRYKSISSYLFSHAKSKNINLIYQAQSELIIEDFKIIIAKMVPDCFTKDLNIEIIKSLNVELARNGFSGSQLVGTVLVISEYQRFFVVLNPDDFRFYYNEYHEQDRDCIKIAGKLITTRPKMIALARYENSTYRMEMSRRLSYQTVIRNPNVY